jgi:hypothetical protein
VPWPCHQSQIFRFVSVSVLLFFFFVLSYVPPFFVSNVWLIANRSIQSGFTRLAGLNLITLTITFALTPYQERIRNTICQ